LKLISYASLIWLLHSCSSSAKTNSFSTTRSGFINRYFTPQIDGEINEWGPLLSYDRFTKCLYAIGNDTSSLYIALRAADRTQQMKILDAGLEIWLNTNGKKNKSIGVKFPLGTGAAAVVLGRVPGNESKEMRQQVRQQWMNMELTGFKYGLNGEQNIIADSSPVKAVIQWDGKGNMDYELKIPFFSLDKTAATCPEKWYVGIFINGMDLPDYLRPGLETGLHSGMKQHPDPDRADSNRLDDITRGNFFWTKYTIANE